MPLHDWSNVDAGVFHDFHQAWTIELCHALNGGLLPRGLFALVEKSDRPIHETAPLQSPIGGGTTVADGPPHARFITSAEPDVYAGRANRILIKHRLGQVVAVIEIVSPGNKDRRSSLRTFVEKAAELLRQGINLLVVDLFPPTPRDPQGIHKAIWDEFHDEPFELPADKPLTVAAYAAAIPRTAYVEPVAVGDTLPSLPIFLESGIYVPAPLENSYQTTWAKCPIEVRELVENGSGAM